MINYNNSKLYKIISPSHPDKIFIGATIQKLTTRKATHRYNYKQYMKGLHHYMPSFDVIKYDDAKLILISNINAFDRAHLTGIQEHYIYNLKKNKMGA
jgi:hypothetical protein